MNRINRDRLVGKTIKKLSLRFGRSTVKAKSKLVKITFGKQVLANSTFFSNYPMNIPKRNQLNVDSFVKAGNFKKIDIVLDVGTGTGVIAHSVSPLVKEIIGLDKSQDMLKHSNWYGNMYFI